MSTLLEILNKLSFIRVPFFIRSERGGFKLNDGVGYAVGFVVLLLDQLNFAGIF